MSQLNKHYLVLARKYRPKKLSDLIGQKEISAILEGALTQNRLAHAYLLSGTRGVGKTTLARIIAKLVNCLKNDREFIGDPCCECSNCLSIDKENNIDVIELDAASKTGVSDVREIIENVTYKPVSALKKIYIIDEVHMLSKAAFNALLKTLEEPPQDVLFILATTETQKVPLTILSRCQHFELKRIELDVLSDHIMKICSLENIKIDKQSAEVIARCSEGSVRDALSILDNVITRSDNISEDIVKEVLGLSDINEIFELFEYICLGDVSSALTVSDRLFFNGIAFEQLGKDLMNLLYYIARVKTDFSKNEIGLNQFALKKIIAYSKKIEMDVIMRLWELMQKYFEEINKSYDQRKSFEMSIIRLCFVAHIPTPFESTKKNIDDLKSKEGSVPINDSDVKNDKNKNQNPENEEKEQFKTYENLALQPKTLTSDKSEKVKEDKEISMLFEYEKLVDKIEKMSEFFISHHLTHNFKLVSLKLPEDNNDRGILELQNILEKNIKENILWKVSKVLEEATGSRWIVSIVNSGGQQTLNEIYESRKAEKISKLSQLNEIKKLLEIIPSSEIVAINDIVDDK